MALYDQFQWAPGEGMAAVSETGLRQAQTENQFATADNTKVETAQKQAELDEYISETAKQMRESQRQAAIGKAQEEIASSESLKNFYANNPGMRDEQTALKNHAEMMKLSKSISDDEADIEHTSVAKWYDPVTGKVNTDVYLAERPNMIKSGAFKEDELPTGEDLINHPEALTTLASAGAYSFNTQEQKAAKAAAAELAKNKLKEQGQQDAQQMARLKAELKVKVDEGKLDRDSREKIQAGHDTAKLEAADKKAKAQITGKAMKPDQFGNILDQRFEAGKTFDIMTDQLGLNIDEDTARLAKNKIWAAAMSEYATQAKMFEKGERTEHPAGPEDIASLMTQKAFANPKGYEQGIAVLNTGKLDIDRPDTTNQPQSKIEKINSKQETGLASYKDHLKAMPQEGRGQQADPAYDRKVAAWKSQSEQLLKTSGFNERQIKMMQDPDFISATSEEQKEALAHLNK